MKYIFFYDDYSGSAVTISDFSSDLSVKVLCRKQPLKLEVGKDVICEFSDSIIALKDEHIF